MSNFLGTLTVTKDWPVCTGPQSLEPVTASTGSGIVSPGKLPDLKEMLKQLISVVVAPELTHRSVVTDGELDSRGVPL